MNLDKSTLKLIVDEVFAAIEGATSSHPFAVAILKAANGVVDDVLLDLIIGKLAAKGVQ